MPPRRDGVQDDLGAEVVAADQRPRPEHLGGEARDHVGEPVRRVGVARALLGVAVQRQVGQHDAEAVRRACSTIGSNSMCESIAECSSASGGPAPSSR